MDLRIPVSLIFILLGGILAIYGLMQPDDIPAVDLGLRVNLIWGMAMCLFGAILGAAVLISRRRS
jgi:ABC-type Fe3+-siderophore transport system permease subunit